MTKVIIDKEKLEDLLRVLDSDCPADIFDEEICWCSNEYCLKHSAYDCIKKWLGVKELPQHLKITELEKTCYGLGFDSGWNCCLEEILGEEK